MKGKRVCNARAGTKKARQERKTGTRIKRPKALRSVPEGRGYRGAERYHKND